VEEEVEVEVEEALRPMAGKERREAPEQWGDSFQ